MINLNFENPLIYNDILYMCSSNNGSDLFRSRKVKVIYMSTARYRFVPTFDEEEEPYYCSLGQKRYYPKEVEDYISKHSSSLSFDQKVSIYDRCHNGFLAVIHTICFLCKMEPNNPSFTKDVKEAANMLCRQFNSPEIYPECSNSLTPEDFKFKPNSSRAIVTEDMLVEAFRRYAPNSKLFRLYNPSRKTVDAEIVPPTPTTPEPPEQFNVVLDDDSDKVVVDAVVDIDNTEIPIESPVAHFKKGDSKNNPNLVDVIIEVKEEPEEEQVREEPKEEKKEQKKDQPKDNKPKDKKDDNKQKQDKSETKDKRKPDNTAKNNVTFTSTTKTKKPTDGQLAKFKAQYDSLLSKLGLRWELLKITDDDMLTLRIFDSSNPLVYNDHIVDPNLIVGDGNYYILTRILPIEKCGFIPVHPSEINILMRKFANMSQVYILNDYENQAARSHLFVNENLYYTFDFSYIGSKLSSMKETAPADFEKFGKKLTSIVNVINANNCAGRYRINKFKSIDDFEVVSDKNVKYPHMDPMQSKVTNVSIVISGDDMKVTFADNSTKEYTIQYGQM